VKSQPAQASEARRAGPSSRGSNAAGRRWRPARIATAKRSLTPCPGASVANHPASISCARHR